MDQTLTREQLIEKMNIQDVATDIQDQIIAQYGENVIKSVTLHILSKLPSEDKKTFEDLLQQGDRSSIEKFLEEKVPTLNDIIKEKSDQQIELVKKAMSA